MLRRDLTATACGLLATLTLAVCLWPSSPAAPPVTSAARAVPVAQAAPAPPPAPAAPVAPVAPAALVAPVANEAPEAPAPEAPAPEVADPMGPGGPLLAADPVEDAAVHARWRGRLAREDEALVQQAVAAGCDATRAEQVREVLAAKRAARAETVAARSAGRISADELATRARATKRQADAALRALLTPEELAALDSEGARASVIDPTERH